MTKGSKSSRSISDSNRGNTRLSPRGRANLDDVQYSSSGKLNKQNEILDLIERQRWRAVRKRLNSKHGRQLAAVKGCHGITTLGLALGFNAPSDILNLIIDLEPTVGLQKDMLGATALHIACLNGSSLESIKIIVDRYPSLVQARDADLRTPLHHAVEYICSLETVPEPDCKTLFDVIQYMIDIRPDSIHSVDKNCDSPLDLTHIVMSETENSSYSKDESVYYRVEALYQYLKNISLNVYLDKKMKWESQGYDISSSMKQKEISQGTVATSAETEETDDSGL